MAEKKLNPAKQNRYQQIAAWIFQRHYEPGMTSVPWRRDEMVEAAEDLGIDLPKNLGDVVYSIRYRIDFPDSIVDAASDDMEWIIRSTGRSQYSFDLIPYQVRIRPREGLVTTKIPDATPEIIRSSALGDEQALLALVRYNRLIDTFLGVTAYSLQNHLRTTVVGVGQVEVDEIYVAVDRYGRQFVIPVQAKGGNDEIGITQTEQDLAVCRDKWPGKVCRPVSAQFSDDGKIALFELGLQDDQMKVVRETHYQLVDAGVITEADLELYRNGPRDE